MLSGGMLIFLFLAGVTWFFLDSKTPNGKTDKPTITEAIDIGASSSENILTQEVQKEKEADAAVAASAKQNFTQTGSEIASSTASSTAGSMASSSVFSSSTTSVGQENISVGSVVDLSPVVMPVGLDGDSDGLLDEEELLLGTNQTKDDSDNDGFSDLAELERGYNPTGIGRLSQAKNLSSFENVNFSLLYPSTWQFRADGYDSLMFEVGAGKRIQVSLQPNIESKTIVNWYKEQFIGQEVGNSQIFNSPSLSADVSWQGVFNKDGSSVYITDKDKQTIVSISYLADSGSFEYKNIFKAMISSFQLNSRK
jgi:hypothetical protein